jgi:glycosyltransferase involved in cell wall biosynthesis
MKIGFVTSHINKSLQWNWFSAELLKRNIEHVHIIINDYEPIMLKDMQALNVPVHYLHHAGPASHMSNMVDTRKLLKEYKVDLVHTELPHGNMVGQLAARWAGISKRVATCENATWAQDHGSSKHAFIDRLAYNSAKHVITLTDLSKDHLVEHYGLEPEKVTSIGHAIKVEDYLNVDPARVQALKEQVGIREGQVVLGMVARMEAWKGHEYVFEALKNLQEAYPQLVLHIFGSEGGDKEALLAKTSELGLDDKVFYHGFIDDPIAMYQLFDIHVHVPVSEIAETFGITIIEGMISGRPQVLTRSGVSYFSAKDGENSLVVPHQDSLAIAGAIKKLIDDPALGERIAAQAVKDATAEYSYETKVDRHLEIYEKLQ